MRDPSNETQFVTALCGALPEERPHVVAVLADELMRLSRAHGRIQVNRCNRELTDREEKRDDRIEAKITELLTPYGIKPDFGGDPRGYTVKLHLPTKRYNTWGGAESGWGVPQ